jgi:alcohol dehydrogenase (NADP+)
MSTILGYAAKHSISDLRPLSIERREPAANDVAIQILFCGVCHSDVHQVKNEWKNTVYPCMPGHEIVGRVTAAGSGVTRYKAGDLVGVGCMVDSCHHCKSCLEGLEQYCENGFLATYNGNSRNPTEENLTYGGYSESIVVREDFVLRIPGNLDPAGAAPLLCAGITTYSPLRFWKAGPGTTVGVVGLGGLGQMAVKLATAMGATVTVVTTSKDKEAAARKLGAAAVVVSTEKDEMKAHACTLDLILSTVPQPHDPNLYTPLLKRDGVYVVVGCLAPLKAPLDMSTMSFDRKSVGSTLIGGIAETQEVLDFCGEHGIVSEIETIPVDRINEVYKSVDKGEVAFRYVIDMSSLHGKQEDGSLLAKAGL